MLAAGAPAGAGVWRAELADTIRLALPIALTQLGQIAMMTTDLALVGRLGEATVAAASLGNAVAFTCYFVGMGLMSAVAPLAAQAYGARKPRMVRRALRVGVWAAVMLGLPLMPVQFNGERLLLALGQAPETAALAGRYLMGLGLEHGSRLVLCRTAGLHGRGQPPAAGALDHARRDPAQRGSCLPA